MLWIFDQASASQGTAGLFFDGLVSLARQWLLRSGSWKVAVALALAVVQVVLGGFSLLLFGQHRVAALTAGSRGAGLAEFAHRGSIAHQPLTVGMVMYLAVFVLAGLVLMIVGLTFWTKAFSQRRVR